MSNKVSTASDLRGITSLMTEATVGITDLVETMQKRIVHPPLLPSTPIQHLISSISGLTYWNIKKSTQLIGLSLEKILELMTPLLGEYKTTAEREAILSALNGVVGDHLESKGNTLNINMHFRYGGRIIRLDRQSIEATIPRINGRILIMVHGLCMNDLLWKRKNHDHGFALSEELNTTTIYLNYNSGRHISSNGRNFNQLLEQLIQSWPVNIEELVIIGHSMGGLVTRSALYYSDEQHSSWVKYLKKVFFLGTPHHGSYLEKAGNYLDVILESITYIKPFARLGKVRSAGITDLRHGYLTDTDWQDKDRFERHHPAGQKVVLNRHVNFYNIAGVIGKEGDKVSPHTIGDGLVRLKSAIGQHSEPGLNLNFDDQNSWISYETSHLDLLSSLSVYAKIKEWLNS